MEWTTVEDFAIILKNARSLTSDERLVELIAELSGMRWDAVLINETWREKAEEFDILEDDHMWFGSGGMAGKRGVGILLHKRWAKDIHRWRAISERIGVLELDIQSVRLSLAVVYMPHCGYSDESVQEIYDMLEQLHQEARKGKRVFIIGGDWNAEVRATGDDTFVGKFANCLGNARGDWLRRWATSQKLLVTNMIVKKR